MSPVATNAQGLLALLPDLQEATADKVVDDEDILSCPFKSLRQAYLSLYTEVDQLNVAALESEVFQICTERQQQIKAILANEKELKELLAEPEVVTVAAPAPVEQPIEPVAPEPIAELKQAKVEEEDVNPLTCAAPYTTAAILGSPVMGPGLSAVIVDEATGSQLTVKEGDFLPGGVRVEEVTTSGVIIGAGNEREKLAHRASKSAVSDGGGLIWEPAAVEELYGAPLSTEKDKQF
jgi:hypothetical protein